MSYVYDNVRHMGQTTTPSTVKTPAVKYPRVISRVSVKLRARLDMAIKKTNQSEADITRTALDEFFRNNKTAAQISISVMEAIRRGE